MRYVILIASVLITSSCTSNVHVSEGIETIVTDEFDWKAMEESRKKHNERMRNELVILMPLETMFPDRQVRALAQAAGKGRVKKIEELITQGVDVNAQGKQNATPLFWALRNSNIDGFEKLLALGADPNIIFAGGSVMHWAARHKINTSFLRSALSYGGDPNLRAGWPSKTPLFNTIGNGESMHLLLDSGANIDAITGNEEIFGSTIMGGQTLAMNAADLGRYEIVYDLLLRGADYQHKDDSGRDLIKLINRDNGLYPAGSKPDKFLKKVITWLSDRGVTVPE